MQKIKEVLSGNSSDDHNSSTGSNVSREYDSSRAGHTTASGVGHDRLTGDSANVNALPSGRQTEHTHTPGTKDETTGVSGTRGLAGNLGNTTGSTGSTGLRKDLPSGGDARVSGNDNSTGLHSGGFEKHAHDHSLASKFDPSAATTKHDHKHLQHVEHRDVRHIETEEVTRQREHDRHVHHVQHHVQPVTNQEVRDEVHHETVHPVTKIHEQHVNTDEDRSLLRGLSEKHRDTETHRGKERTVIDKGETVTENVHHHVHHVTQPVVETEVHDRHRIHTVIPTHHVTHEAPIIHKSSIHEPIHMADFKKGGGVLGSNTSLENANVLQSGECVREVDGVGEKLAKELHLSSGHSSKPTAATPAN